MSDMKHPDERQNQPELTWEEVQAFVQKRQSAMDAGIHDLDADEDGPSWEQVHAFVQSHAQEAEAMEQSGDEESGSLLAAIKDMFKSNSMNEEEWAVEEKRRRKIVETLLPDGNVRPLFTSETCLLCKDQPQPRELYAITDMGHKEPKSKKSSAIGVRVRAKVGSLVPLQIACCKRCRKNYRIASYLSLVVMLVVIVLGLLLLSLAPVARALEKAHEATPLLLFIATVPVGWLLGRVAAQAFIKAHSHQTKFDIGEIPFVARMEAAGWFPLYEGKEVSRLVFSKERLKGDWFTQ